MVDVAEGLVHDGLEMIHLSRLRGDLLHAPLENDPERLLVVLSGLVGEAAKMLGVSAATVRQYVARGRLRAVRVGRRVLVPMEVLEQVIVEGVPAGRR